MASPRTIGLITARGGSKGVPGKNIRPVAGKPLLTWTIEAARHAKSIGRILLSTDDPVIAEVGREAGAEVPFLRPAEFAGDSSSHISVVNHALDWLEAHVGLPEFLCLLQPTSPLRLATDIDAAITAMLARSADSIVAVGPAESHPYLTRRINADGTLAEFIATDMHYPRRQDLPPAYVINGALYVIRSTVFRKAQTFLPPGTLAYVMPPERSIDVDTLLNFVLVEHILQNRAPYV